MSNKTESSTRGFIKRFRNIRLLIYDKFFFPEIDELGKSLNKIFPFTWKKSILNFLAFYMFLILVVHLKVEKKFMI